MLLRSFRRTMGSSSRGLFGLQCGRGPGKPPLLPRLPATAMRLLETLHSLPASVTAFKSVNALRRKDRNKCLTHHLTGLPFSSCLSLTSVIYQGILQCPQRVFFGHSFPALEFVLQWFSSFSIVQRSYTHHFWKQNTSNSILLKHKKICFRAPI